MSASRMISINTKIYNQPIEVASEIKVEKKLKIKFFLPPSDIPQLINQNYNENEDLLIFEFKYIDSEKEKQLFHRNNIRLFVGTYSGKPLRLEIQNIKKENITSVRLEHIISSLEEFLSQESLKFDFREQSNLKLAGVLFAQNAKKLAEANCMS